MNEFEKSVRKSLIDKDMTMSDLANKMGISPSYLHDLLKGKRDSVKRLKQIKEVLGL